MKTLIALGVAAGLLVGMLGVSSVVAPRDARPSKAFASKPASAKRTAKTDTAVATGHATAADARRANEVFADLQKKHRLLEDVTVRMGTTPNDEQAVAYYTLDEIIISPTHKATLEEILAHEVWHIIDWRDNGRLDWGENLPPVDSSDYLTRSQSPNSLVSLPKATV